MIDQRAIAIHHVQVGVVTVEVLVQQAIQHIVFMQVQRAGDIAQVAVVARENRMRIQNHPAAGVGLVGFADGRLLRTDRVLRRIAGQMLPQQLRVCR
ncbi:hypothetical protein D3C71_1193100 [compost metagenome]